jgi:capsid protein
MASVTLAESAKLAQNQLIAGVIENIITVNPFFEVVPFDGITGNALQYTRENAQGGIVVAGVGSDLTADLGTGAQGVGGGAAYAKAAATFTSVTTSLTTIIGDAEVNNLIEETRSDDGNPQAATQIASKAKHAGRKYQDMLINGTGASNQFNGLINLCAAGQKVDTGVNGGALSFAFLDELLDLVTDKDGQVDWICMHERTLRSFKALLRALGGAGINDTVELPSGQRVMQYSGVPIFKNNYIPINQTKGTGTAQTTVFAGTFDDGSRQHGIAGITAERMAGIRVVDVGESETRDEHIWRVKWYSGLALFSEKGLSCAEGITN